MSVRRSRHVRRVVLLRGGEHKEREEHRRKHVRRLGILSQFQFVVVVVVLYSHRPCTGRSFTPIRGRRAAQRPPLFSHRIPHNRSSHRSCTGRSTDILSHAQFVRRGRRAAALQVNSTQPHARPQANHHGCRRRCRRQHRVRRTPAGYWSRSARHFHRSALPIALTPLTTYLTT